MKRCMLGMMIVMVVFPILQIPVLATPEYTYKGGTVEIAGLSSFTFNWTWWGMDLAKSLSFSFTTNNVTTPLFCSVNNSRSVIFERYDYFVMATWNSSEFPRTNEVWWFTLTNIRNITVTATINLYYDIQVKGDTLSLMSLVIVAITVISITLFITFAWWIIWKRRGLTTIRNRGNS